MKFFKAVAAFGFGLAAAQDDACHTSHKASHGSIPSVYCERGLTDS